MTGTSFGTSRSADHLVEQLARLGYASHAVEQGLAVRVDLGHAYPHAVTVWTPDSSPHEDWTWDVRRHVDGLEMRAEHHIAARRRVPIHLVARHVAATLPSPEPRPSEASDEAGLERVGS